MPSPKKINRNAQLIKSKSIFCREIKVDFAKQNDFGCSECLEMFITDSRVFFNNPIETSHWIASGVVKFDKKAFQSISGQVAYDCS